MTLGAYGGHLAVKFITFGIKRQKAPGNPGNVAAVCSSTASNAKIELFSGGIYTHSAPMHTLP